MPGSSPRASLLERLVIVVAMAVGSIMLWLGWPLGLIYAVSKQVDTAAPQLGPYVAIIVGVPLGMALIARGLGGLDRLYARRTAGAPERYRPGWLASTRGERTRTTRWKVLDVVMLWSVATAALAATVWFVAFPASPLG